MQVLKQATTLKQETLDSDLFRFVEGHLVPLLKQVFPDLKDTLNGHMTQAKGRGVAVFTWQHTIEGLNYVFKDSHLGVSLKKETSGYVLTGLVDILLTEAIYTSTSRFRIGAWTLDRSGKLGVANHATRKSVEKLVSTTEIIF